MPTKGGWETGASWQLTDPYSKTQEKRTLKSGSEEMGSSSEAMEQSWSGQVGLGGISREEVDRQSIRGVFMVLEMRKGDWGGEDSSITLNSSTVHSITLGVGMGTLPTESKMDVRQLIMGSYRAVEMRKALVGL
jgi:hypothetical protein